jgi:sterol desaturase/sphingolipid hydroxylase (fatty acid hydroxylase superfamily)
MTAATILSQIGFSVAAFGWRFRLYAILSAVTIIMFGALASMQAAKLPTGQPTPWLGLFDDSASHHGCCGWQSWPSCS